MADRVSASIADASLSSSRNLVPHRELEKHFSNISINKATVVLTCMDFVKMTQDFFCAVLMAGIILFAYCIIFGNVL